MWVQTRRGNVCFTCDHLRILAKSLNVLLATETQVSPSPQSLISRPHIFHTLYRDFRLTFLSHGEIRTLIYRFRHLPTSPPTNTQWFNCKQISMLMKVYVPENRNVLLIIRGYAPSTFYTLLRSLEIRYKKINEQAYIVLFPKHRMPPTPKKVH